MPVGAKPFLNSCFVLCCVSLFVASHAVGMRAQDALSESSQLTLTNSIGMKLVQIPAGRFSMGSPASEPGSEEHEVLHKVELTQAYYLGITEVTEHQWALVMEDAFRTEVREVRDKETNRLIRKEEVQIRNPKLDSQLPITNVSWQQAVEFCQRLSQLPEEKKEGRQYRLPTEAEWEHACRAGTASAYSFGDDRSMLSTYGWQGVNQPQPVGQKKPNAWGLYDMHGNAAEWCFDFFGTYSEDLIENPSGPARLLSVQFELQRVMRGGSVGSKESGCRSAWRGSSRQSAVSPNTGFRVALGSEIRTEIVASQVNSIGLGLITIPPGKYLMGSETGDKDERPVQEISLNGPFQISATEVTQRQWKLVMATTPWKGQPKVIEDDDYPASYVSWEDAMEFCQRLSQREQERVKGRVYRLPTEAEWEYACRAGSSTEYHFGDSLENLQQFAWYERNSAEGPHPVASKPPNAFALYDTHGNVWEWCNDDYQTKRIFRGGSYRSDAAGCRSANRDSDFPSKRSGTVGFRVALNATNFSN